MDSPILIENNNQVNVDNLNKEAKEIETKDDESTDELDSIFRNNKNTSKKDNSLNKNETNLSKTSKSNSSIQHPLNTNEEFSTPSSTLNFNQTKLLQNTPTNKFLNDFNFRNDFNQQSSPNSTTNRQSILNNFNSWLSDIYSGSLLQNFLFTNPFKSRRDSKTQNSPNISRSSSKQQIETNRQSTKIKEEDNSSVDFYDAKLIIGTLKPTLRKDNELIELSNFNVEIDIQETGLGHRFEFYPLTNHTFCDSCSSFIWTPIVHESMKNWNTLTQKIISPFSQTVRCTNCHYICHYKCSKFVRINCQKTIDLNQIEFRDVCDDEISDNKDEEEKNKQEIIDSNILEEKINKYNERIVSKGSGLGIYLLEDRKTFRGFLKVHLNLTRPINVIAGTRPPSIYDILNEDTSTKRTLTTFYMPRDTTKSLHINSKNTTVDVIKSMLKKFKMVDNHQKFALYKRFTNKDQKVILSRINDNDYPLRIALDWLDSDEKQFVLLENENADVVNWSNFELPELRNFLKILDHEEKQHILTVKKKYKNLREELDKLINYKSIFSDAVYV